MASATLSHRAVIGNASSFWLYSSQTGFDLTHPPSPSSPQITPRLTIPTTSKPITVDPAKTALVVIDMQNFFLSPAFGRDTQGAGHRAMKELVDYTVPAARTAGVRVVWVNWGLTEQDVGSMPPGVTRAFGFEAFVDEEGQRKGVVEGGGERGGDAVFKEREGGFGVDNQGTRKVGGDVVVEGEQDEQRAKKVHKGLGSSCGFVTDPATGKEVDAGRLLMRDTWNAALQPPLDAMYIEGAALPSRPDVWIHKNRMSALWGSGTALEQFLEDEGIRTLLFSGVNTDQCVGGTLQDAFSKGYDCVLLRDGAGTTSPEYAQQCMEFNAGKTWGFSTTCREFAEGAAKMG